VDTFGGKPSFGDCKVEKTLSSRKGHRSKDYLVQPQERGAEFTNISPTKIRCERKGSLHGGMRKKKSTKKGGRTTALVFIKRISRISIEAKKRKKDHYERDKRKTKPYQKKGKNPSGGVCVPTLTPALCATRRLKTRRKDILLEEYFRNKGSVEDARDALQNLSDEGDHRSRPRKAYMSQPEENYVKKTLRS